MPKRKSSCLNREVPEPVKREIRKRCGFGCIKCGRLFCEYHHFAPEFPKAEGHNPQGITLLCPNHHADCTSGRINNDSIRKHDQDPYCLKKGHSKYLLEDLEFPLEVVLGSIVFISDDGVLLKIDDEEILGITSGTEDEPPYINSKLSLNSGDDLIIVKNEIIAGTKSWDIESKSSEITIRKKLGDIALNLFFEPPRRIFIKRIKMNYKGNIIETEFEGKILIKTPSGAMIDFARGEIVIGGQLLLDSSKGIQITNGSRVFGLEKELRFEIDLSSLFAEVRGFRGEK